MYIMFINALVSSKVYDYLFQEKTKGKQEEI